MRNERVIPSWGIHSRVVDQPCSGPYTREVWDSSHTRPTRGARATT